MKRWLMQEVDRDGKVIRTRAFMSRASRDSALLDQYVLAQSHSWFRAMHRARLRDPNGYSVDSTIWTDD